MRQPILAGIAFGTRLALVIHGALSFGKSSATGKAV
jgi:hypothetical protein